MTGPDPGSATERIGRPRLQFGEEPAVEVEGNGVRDAGTGAFRQRLPVEDHQPRALGVGVEGHRKDGAVVLGVAVGPGTNTGSPNRKSPWVNSRARPESTSTFTTARGHSVAG